MTDESKKTICFGFNANFRLVEATGDMATVIAWQDYEGHREGSLSDAPRSGPCGLRLTRSDLHQMLDAWLDEKAGYCERFGGFGGYTPIWRPSRLLDGGDGAWLRWK